ncbi:MAG: hypothetical protein JNL32_09945 [Candidatus Kapabacteria bacterium]|nr:hypothetical protein [Candidatus Kapabacteria bacterium]
MRLTTTSMFSQYATNVNEISSRQARNQIRVFTGKNMVNLGDDPNAVTNIQTFSESISKSENYKRNIQEALDEQSASEGALQGISNSLDEIRQLGVESLQIANQDKLPVLGEKLRKFLTSLVDGANHQYNGVYVFSGTKTTAASLTPTGAETQKLPFEIVQETPTASNPSGLRVTFKGNNDERSVNTGAHATERVSSTAEDAFGTGGTEMFTNVIALYNKLMYKQDGTPRTDNGDFATKADRDNIAGLVKHVTDSYETLNAEIGKLGARTQRFDAMNSQIDEDILRMKEFRSREEDTDVAQAIMEMQKDDLAMSYALKVGSKIMSQSLLDFLR